MLLSVIISLIITGIWIYIIKVITEFNNHEYQQMNIISRVATVTPLFFSTMMIFGFSLFTIYELLMEY